MAKLHLDHPSVKAILPPAKGNRIDYDVPGGPRDRDFVRGLAVRTTAAGTKTFLLVYVTKSGQERRHVIGDLGPHTVTTARAAAGALRRQVDEGRDPFADELQARAAASAAKIRGTATFGRMLLAYVERLRHLKKASAAKVEAEVRRTIEAPFPKLWAKAAADVTLDDLLGITEALAGAGKLRQAEKTRSYLRAAFNMAAMKRGKTGIETLFAEFNVANIAATLSVIERDRQPAEPKRALSIDELRAYWKRIKATPTAGGALLRLHLLTGAQRVEQLARLTSAAWDADAGLIVLQDPKGRRRTIRNHAVPLLPDAEAALKALGSAKGGFLFSADAGQSPVDYSTFRRLVLEIAGAMVKAGETDARFTPGDLRRTVETRLAAAGVSREIRGHLLSHGLHGVQHKHYDMHEYFKEKRAALVTLRRLLEPGLKVVPIRSTAA